MTISNTIRTAGPYIGNGVTTAFPFYFKIFKTSDLLAVQTDVATGLATSLVLNSGYTVTLNPDQNANPGGTATLPAALATGKTLVLTSSLDYLQPLDITNGGGFYPAVLNAALDRLTIFCQQLFSLASRSLKIPLSDTGMNTELPSAAARANKLLGFDASGRPIVAAPVSGSAAEVAIDLANTINTYASSSGSSLIGHIISGIGGVYRTLKSKWQGYVDVYDFGVVGDGIADDTVAMQKSLDHGNLKNLLVRGLDSIVKISGPLTMAGPGLTWDRIGYFQGFLVTGTGYTALTVTGRPNTVDIAMRGSGNACHGILFNNIAESTIGHLRVTGLLGRGLEFRQSFDWIAQDISVEDCGSLTDYMFSVTDGAGTSNEFHINRLQVEKGSKGLGIFISPNTVSFQIDVIHSEQMTGYPGTNTWQLGGNGGQYNVTRLDASGGTPSDATALFSGAACQFNTARVEGGAKTVIEGYTSNPLIFINPYFVGKTSLKTGQTGTISIEGGTISDLDTGALGLRAYGTRILSLKMGFASADPTQAIFDGCQIGTLASTSTLSAATFSNCQIAAGTVLGAYTIFNDCKVNFGASYNIASTRVDCNNTELVCAALTVSNALLNLRNGSSVNGDATFTGNFNSMADDSSYCSGTVTGWNSPQFATFLPGGAFRRGMRSRNIWPAVGSPKAWTYNGATWASEGNL